MASDASNALLAPFMLLPQFVEPFGAWTKLVYSVGKKLTELTSIGVSFRNDDVAELVGKDS